MSDKRKHLPMLIVGTIGGLAFAAWNIQRALVPQLAPITKQIDLAPIVAAVPTTTDALPRSRPEDARATPGTMIQSPPPTVEELLAPNADPFRPLRAADPTLRTVMTQLTPTQQPAAGFPQRPLELTQSAPANSGTVGYVLPVAPVPPAVKQPAVTVRPAPVLPNAGQATASPALLPTAPKPAAPAPAAVPDPPDVVGTLLGDEPSAVFEKDGNTEIVLEGDQVGEWIVLRIDADHVTLKHLASGKKVRVAVASSGISG